MEVADVGAVRRLLGQIVPPQHAEVEVRWAGGSVDVSADQLGRFSVGAVPSGPVSLACRLPGRASRVTTSWVAI